jgi:hypothetical protein
MERKTINITIMGRTTEEEEVGRLGSFITSERPGMVKRSLGSHQTSQPQSAHCNTDLTTPTRYLSCGGVNDIMNASLATSARRTDLFDSRLGTTVFILCVPCPWTLMTSGMQSKN